LAAGATGLPVFTPMGAPGLARFVGPTGGYLLAYPAAAFVAGALAARRPSLGGRWLAGIVGIILFFLCGIAQLNVLTGSLTRAFSLGVTPFAALDIVKALAAAWIAGPRTMRRRA